MPKNFQASRNLLYLFVEDYNHPKKIKTKINIKKILLYCPIECNIKKYETDKDLNICCISQQIKN